MRIRWEDDGKQMRLYNDGMNDADFLRSIAESPDDDQPRLIYADYLEEQGQGERVEKRMEGLDIGKPI